MAPHRRAGLFVLIAVVAAAGLAVLLSSVLTWHSEDEPALAALVLLAAVCERFDFAPLPNSRFSMSIALILAATVFSGLSGLALVAVAVAAADYLAHPKALFKAVYNLGVLLVAGVAFYGVLEAFSPTHDPGDWLDLLGPMILGSVVAYVINSALVTLAISVDTGRAPADTWSASFLWILPHYVLLGLIGLLIAASYDRWELPGIALIVVPLAMVWLVLKQSTTGGANQRLAP
jgi:hypothetical protein